MAWLNYTVAGNELWRLMAFTASVLLALAAGRLARFFGERAAVQLERGPRSWRAIALRSVARPAALLGLAVGLRVGFAILSLDDGLRSLGDTVWSVAISAAIGYAMYSLVDLVDYYLVGVSDRTESRVDDVLAPLVGKSIRISVAVLVVINVVHQVSGKSISTILAGLGVGGLAVALAGQDTIRNFFGSIVILADRPFEVGDRVVIDGHDGPVESVGFRSTRIRTLEGHQVTVPNSEMVNKTIQNIGRRPHIRRLTHIAITYNTPPAKVRRALEIVRGILDGHEGMDPAFPPRVYFSEFADSSLNLIMIYWYHPASYWDYMAFTERVNLEILERFNAEQIDFAFPTRTVYLCSDSVSGDSVNGK